MSGFQFPPPPPPPPSSRPDQHQVGPRGQSEPRGRGRGRGRGTNDHGSRGRGGYGRGNEQQRQRGQPHRFASSGAPLALDQTQLPDHPINGSSTGNAIDAQAAAPYMIPPGSYINPAFANTANPLGDGFNSNVAARGRTNWQQPGKQGRNTGSYPSTAQPNNSSISCGSRSTPTAGVRKRKLDAFQQQSPLSQTREITGEPTNPSIPSFGAPILPETNLSSSRPEKYDITKRGAQKQSNILGLTPQQVDPLYSSESDDEEEMADEEAILAKGLGPGLTFHDANGEMKTLNSAADLLAWRTARRKNFPTKDRITEKYAEKRRIGAERGRLLTGAKEKLDEAMAGSSVTNSRATTTAAHDPPVAKGVPTSHSDGHLLAGTDSKDAGTEFPQSPSAARSANVPPASSPSKLHYANLGNRTTHRVGVLAAETPGPQPTHDPGVEVESSSIPTKANSSPLVSDAELSDDEPPEEIAIKRQPRSDTASIPCRFFTASGYCRDGSDCRFKHEISKRGGYKSNDATFTTQRRDPYAPLLDAPDHSHKKSLHQRLLEREQQDEDKIALQVIKYLGSMDFFAADSLTK
ncbi:hypothetical protein CB0940_00876 [Cercospora beticola]|uniref:C3H1-type domain-containing protein n=1 Tax=Cercospora beticola TaxID=122368 RepID=A0A2G5IBM8_CERBT|nr:hypothetical protein CB0940_00876 [Cercospora beticola]PIB02257.1 hypothetical protein CB0940_00876 [Cercospora beticola]WPA96304.1 hypothetical protein RHO25_000910 [Cercospora beticola]CAK1355397.1 unnamed protein product [Cercospora beticola]